jgi:hypothetical protein
MGEGLIRATVATAKRIDHIILVQQPDTTKVVMQCQRCGIAWTHDLPSSIPSLVQSVKKFEKAHKNCKQ